MTTVDPMTLDLDAIDRLLAGMAGNEQLLRALLLSALDAWALDANPIWVEAPSP